MRRLFKIGADRHDSGPVRFIWHPEGNFIASAGRNGIVQITDRHGEIVDEVPMNVAAPILSLSWDKDGEFLAILQEGNGVVPLFNLSTRRLLPLETGLKDPTFIQWSKTGPQLAVGTSKGNLLIYNKSKKQKIPVIGKHGKRITCGAWALGTNKLALGSDDRTLTVSDENGDTLIHAELTNLPTEVLFTHRQSKSNDIITGTFGVDNTISAIMDGKSILLHNIVDEGEDPMELTFAQVDNGSGCKYGDILQHSWVDENLLLVGFSSGTLLLVSTGEKDLGEEKFAIRFHNNSLIAFSYNPILKRFASAGDDGVRIVDIKDFKESEGDFISRKDLEDGKVNSLSWSPDGQILTVSTLSGNVYNFLAKMNVLSAKYQTSIAYLTSLREVSIVDISRKNRPIDVTLKLEPAIIALGLTYLAASMNNRVYYHKLPSNSNITQVLEQEYISAVRNIQLNEIYVVILTDSKAILHPIDPNNSNNTHQTMKTFPSREEGSFSKVTCISLTNDFLYYGTEAGTVELFYLDEWVLLSGSELRLDNPIKSIYPNQNGTRIIIVDKNNQVYLYNPIIGSNSSSNQSILLFDMTPKNIVNILWDIEDNNIILIYDGRAIHTYIYIPTTYKGSILTKLGPITISPDGEIELVPDKFDIIPGYLPILSVGGMITCQSISGELNSIIHPYFDQILEVSNFKQTYDKKVLIVKYCQALALLKLEVAWIIANEIDMKQYWLSLSGKAMELLDIDLAIKVYRQLGDAGKVMALLDIINIEDKLLLSGYIAILFDDYVYAQDLFLSSSYPMAALEMRKDLLQWDQALKLAEALQLSSEIPYICIQYGQILEFKHDIELALKIYENAVQLDSTNTIALSGIARCSLKVGNLRNGIRLANDINENQLYIDCGDILLNQKQYNDAVSIYLKANQYDKAALIYTKYLIKQDKSKIKEAASIMNKVQNDSLNSSFARLCITAGNYIEAMKAYERAKDIDKVVELKLRNLDQIQEAFDIARQSATSQGAQVVADYCIETKDFRGAIEFLLIANKSEDAFKLAITNNLMDIYTSFIQDTISADDAEKIANYYEKQQDFGKAGRYYSICGKYAKALSLFIQCGDREIDEAIAVVGKSQNEKLIHQLIDFLVGEKDGVPKDPNYIYRLHMALKKYEDAAKTALIIARQEQDLGNYSLAHSVISEIIRHLEDNNIRVSLQIRQLFILLHSYILVKIFVKHNDHVNAARLLLRVAQNISKFPQHMIPILISTVIECQRGGLKKSSYEYAVMLMRPEHRLSIDVNIRRKIEMIVRRKSSIVDETPEDLSPDPISNQLIPCTQLESPVTRDAIPMCIITGKHLVLDDWCFCPNSKFPALYSEYLKYIEREIALQSKLLSGDNTDNQPQTNGSLIVNDPVINKPITVNDLKLCTKDEALAYIQKYNDIKSKENDANAAKEDANAVGNRTNSEDTDVSTNKSKSNSKNDANSKSTNSKDMRNRRERSKRAAANALIGGKMIEDKEI